MRISVGNTSRVWLAIAIAGILIGIAPSPVAHASLENCGVTVSPGSADVGTSTSFSFDVTNNSSSSIQWLRITAPAGGIYTVESATAGGWTADPASDSVTFSSGSLPAPYDQVFVLDAYANTASSGASWLVQASDDPGGASPITCNGDTNVYNPAPPIFISNVRLSDLTDTSVTVLWDTNVDGTTQVNYGSTGSYGSSSTKDNNLVSSHSVTLTGLSANTGYHYRAVSIANGDTAYSVDSTFITAVGPVQTPQTGGGGGGGNNGGTSGQASAGDNSATGTPSGQNAVSIGRGIAILAKPTEAIAPTISLTSTVAGVVKIVPTITGTADDNASLARIEYSTDNGKNWLPVDTATGLGSPHASFSFTPTNLEDGDYLILARAIDLSGNVGTTTAIKTVIDRLPPNVGGNILSLGPQILNPDDNGTVATLAQVNQKITLSAVGGPTSVALQALHTDSKAKPQVFTLTKSDDTGLWSGLASFVSPGKYTLIAVATDGAGNKTSRTLNTVYVYSPGKTLNATTKKPVATTVTVYCLEPDTSHWVVWDGASYGQQNPQKTGSSGSFQALLPPGTYYVKARASGYQTAVSSIFTTTSSKPLVATLKMTQQSILHISGLSVQAIDGKAQAPSTPQKNGQGSLIGKQAPDFLLSDTSGSKLRATDLLGKPTVLTMTGTWAPTTAEQLGTLATLQKNPEFNILPVALEEGSAKAQAYTNITGLKVRWLVDPDGTLSQAYAVQSIPTHYFIDRKGIIRHVVTGVLTTKDLVDMLSGL